MLHDADIAKQITSPAGSDGAPFAAGVSIPSDVLDSGARRVRIAALSSFSLWLWGLTTTEFFFQFYNLSPAIAKYYGTRERVLILSGLVISLALWWIAGRLRSRPQLVLDVGLIFMVLISLIISLVAEYHPRYDGKVVTWVCPCILVWAAIAPSAPRKTLIASLAAASTVPLAIWFSHQTNPSPIQPNLILLFLVVPPYLCALLAVVPATIMRRLGQQVAKARELGSYQLEELIGKGGMGEVYRAKHRLLARPAAIKLISPTALRSDAVGENQVIVERFRREAEAASSLSSPHTIELYDYGVAGDGTFYYVMELLDGIDLHELVIRHGETPPERALHLIRQACDSLGEAHLQGLVHRDVKPSNILACRKGLSVDFVKVLDFGLVKKEPHHSEPQQDLTSAGMVKGTPAFMAPESVTESPVGPAADVYAIGCVTYWLLTGQHVFKAANETMMMLQHVQASPVPPSARTKQPIPADLEHVVMRCLSKDPEKRFGNAVELAHALDSCRLPFPWTAARALDWWQMHRHPETTSPTA